MRSQTRQETRVAALLAGAGLALCCALPPAAAQSLPGVDPVKVKTIDIGPAGIATVPVVPDAIVPSAEDRGPTGPSLGRMPTDPTCVPRKVKTIPIIPTPITTITVVPTMVVPTTGGLGSSGPSLAPMPTAPTSWPAPGLDLPITKVKTLRINSKGHVLDKNGKAAE